MTTTIPPFDWPAPEDTDPLADGAAAIRMLGAAVGATIVARERRIWTYSGPLTFNASGNATITHGLGAVPSAVLFGAVLGSSIVHLAAASVPSSTSLTVRALTPSGLYTAGLSQVWITLVGGANPAAALPEIVPAPERA